MGEKALQAAVGVAQDFRGAGGQSTTVEAASEGRGCKRAGGVSLGEVAARDSPTSFQEMGVYCKQINMLESGRGMRLECSWSAQTLRCRRGLGWLELQAQDRGHGPGGMR